MKALISPNETYTISWISSWVEEGGEYVPVESFIYDCQRIAQIEQEPFEVAEPLFWVDCTEECRANNWYYKDGGLYARPLDVPKPE